MIILLGYMGSGKTSVGQKLSQDESLSYCDLDDYIVEKEKKSISDIFQSKGEIYFRKKEHQYLKEILDASKVDVLALGGGTPCYAGNMDLVKQEDHHSFYLKVNLETLTNRLFTEKDKRPLIKDIESKIELKDFVRKHLFEREYYYRQANHILNVSELSAEEISKEIMKLSN